MQVSTYCTSPVSLARLLTCPHYLVISLNVYDYDMASSDWPIQVFEGPVNGKLAKKTEVRLLFTLDRCSRSAVTSHSDLNVLFHSSPLLTRYIYRMLPRKHRFTRFPICAVASEPSVRASFPFSFLFQRLESSGIAKGFVSTDIATSHYTISGFYCRISSAIFCRPSPVEFGGRRSTRIG